MTVPNPKIQIVICRMRADTLIQLRKVQHRLLKDNINHEWNIFDSVRWLKAPGMVIFFVHPGTDPKHLEGIKIDAVSEVGWRWPKTLWGFRTNFKKLMRAINYCRR